MQQPEKSADEATLKLWRLWIWKWGLVDTSTGLQERGCKMIKQNELLIRVVERYLYHRSYKSENPVVLDLKNAMLDQEIAEMWMLTQK